MLRGVRAVGPTKPAPEPKPEKKGARKGPKPIVATPADVDFGEGA